MVVVADRPAKHKGGGDKFDQMMEKPRTNHGYPIKHKLKDCELLKCMLGQADKCKADDCDREAIRDPEEPDKGTGPFLDEQGYLMIHGGTEDDCSRRKLKLRHREALAARIVIPRRLC